MKKKGQAAMEFLMTYGWAIVVVLAAIGALAYFGVLSPSKLLPDRTTFTTPVPNIDTAVISMGTSGAKNDVTIAFKNNKGVAISLPMTATVASGSSQCAAMESGVDVSLVGTYTDSTGAQAVLTNTTQISNGGNFILTFNCTSNANAKVGERFKAEFTFPYVNVETQQSLTQTGTVEGKYAQ